MKKQLSTLEKFHVIKSHLEDDVSIIEIANLHGLDRDTIRQWINKYNKQGLAGLDRRSRSDKGQRRLITAELEQLTEALVLKKPPITIAAIHRKVAEVAKKKGLPEPTYRVVWQVARQIDPALIKLAHQGSKAYNQEFELIYRREADAPNEIWQIDHTPLDIVVMDEKGNSAKPWLTTIIDDYSRAISGYYLSLEHPCSINTALALRQAIWRKKDPKWQVCGIPATLYSDNGSDFTSKHIGQVAADLKIRLVNSIPGKPQGRGRIERFFLTTTQLLLMNLSGYAPAGSPWPEANLTLEEFIPLFEHFVISRYHQRIHSTIGMPPIDRWIGNGFLPQLPESLEQLDLLLLTVVRPRKVHRDGIHFQNFIYIAPTLAAYVGEQVSIRYDPRDLAEIRVFYKDKFLCRAVCQQLSGMTISLKEIIKARRRRKRELRKTIAKRKSLMDALLSVPNSENPPAQKAKPIKTVSREAKKHSLKLYKND